MENLILKLKLFHLKYIKYGFFKDFLSQREIVIINNAYVKERQKLIKKYRKRRIKNYDNIYKDRYI